MKVLIEKLRSGLDLQSSEIGYAVVLLLLDEIEDEKKVEFLTALHQKGESADEIVGFVRQLGSERLGGSWTRGRGCRDGRRSICGPTTIAELRNDKITSAVLDAHWLGIARSTLTELRGGGREENAASLKGILAGEITGAKRDLVVINAASGFVVAGLARDLNDGIALAREQIDSGCALAKLRALRNYQPKVSA